MPAVAERAAVALAADFTRAMAGLGPFPPVPRLAVALSGGADSLALALLADDWARERGGDVLALIVDHGLRPEAAAEATETLTRIAGRGIAGRVLRIEGLAAGPAVAARARTARYRVLAAAAAKAERVHLLLGHHAADQAETVLMRANRGSAEGGRAGMAAWRAGRDVAVLRPLLGVAPARLRTFLRDEGLAWVEDPSNHEPRFTRARLRAARADAEGVGVASVALVASARARARARALREIEAAGWLARHVTLRPEGFARLPTGPWPAAAIGPLFAALVGADFATSPAALARLAAAPRPATLGGLRLIAYGGGFLLAREVAAMAAPVVARAGARWDRRFRLAADAVPPEGAMLGALGPAAARLRRRSDLPAAVLRTLPAVWMRETLVAVPHLGYPDREMCTSLAILLDPAQPAAGAPYRG